MKRIHLLSANLFAAAMLLSASTVFAQSNPAVVHDLSGGNFAFSAWADTEAAGMYPTSMYFHRSGTQDPGLAVEMTTDYTTAYNLTSGSRINGMGADGITFVNTGTAGNIGAAIASVNTTGRNNIQVGFVGGTHTIADGSGTGRVYGIRLQYRVGVAGTWEDVLLAGNPVEYLSIDGSNAKKPNGTRETIGPVALPAAAENQPLVQLRWKYYQNAAGPGGTRPRLILDDITVTSAAGGPANVPPALTNRVQLPAQPTSSTPLSFSVDASDTDGTIASVTLFYLVEPAATPSGVFTSAAMSLSAGNTYTVAPAALASVATGNNVFYYFEATDDDADTTQLGSAASPFSVYVNDSRPAAGAFVINEICHTQAAPQPSATDWIEFHNPTASAIDVSYFTFIDNNPGNPRFTFPFGTIIPADGFIVTAQQGGGFTSFSPWNAVTPVGFFNFGLGGSGDSVIVSDDAGVEYDRVDYTNAAPWPLGNLGTSIELTNPLVDNNDGANWTGGPVNGTPGAQNSTVSVSDWFLLVD